MLASTLRRHGGNRAFHDLQQCLLNPLTRYIAGDRWIISLARNLIDLVNIDDAALRALNIIIGCLQQFQNDVFNIFTNVTSFGQRGGIGHGEGHIQHSRKCLREQRLATSGRTNKQNV